MTAAVYGSPNVDAPDASSTGSQDGRGIRVETVADLAAVLASLPPQMPVRLDPVLRAAPGLLPGRDPQVVLATVVPDLCGGFSPTELVLAARLVPEDQAPVPAEALACEPVQRMREAFDAGDLGRALCALADALSDAARDVIDEGRTWLPPGSPQVGDLQHLAASMRHIAADARSRLAAAADAEMSRAELT